MASSPEQKKSYHVSKDFKGVNTKANRTAIGEDEFSWLENAMPIGFGNLKITNNYSDVKISNAAVTWANTVTYFSNANIGVSDYVLAFEEDGRAEYYNITSGTKGNVAIAGTFSNAGVQVSQWENQRVLIIDPVKGYFTWDGNNTVSIGSISKITITNAGTGYTTAPNVTISATQQTGGVNATATCTVANGSIQTVTITDAGTGYTNASNVTVTFSGGGGANAAANVTVISQPGTAIQSFSGRVWIANGRTIYYTAAGSYYDFTSISAGNVILTDATLHGNIQQLLSANNFLYIFGDDSINVFSDVRVNTSGVTLFTNTNVSASVGSRLKYAIFPYFRSVLFMNDYGVYALVGATTSKLSDPLDGVFPYIDFTKPVYAGQVLINNILCACFNFYYTGVGPYPNGTPYNNYIQAVFFEKKWFFTNQLDTVKYITSVPVAGRINLYGSDSSNLVRFYVDSSSNISSIIQTALNAMGDPIRTKQATKIGVEATVNGETTFNIQVDSETALGSTITLSNNITWYNLSGVTIPWKNNSSAIIPWVNGPGYSLYKNDAQQFGKYLGMTVTSNNPGYTLNTFEYEHELRVRF